MTNNIRSIWNLQNWLDYLENIQPIKYNLRLENVREVARRLEVLESKVPVITVGGTNGKGSTVAALTALYSSAGYAVGHFTSPHLIRFNERICINNQQVSDTAAAAFMLEIDNIRGAIDISYFEAALLCALLYFKTRQVDLIVLEVGMGGRLDATNIIDSDITIITSVALDHQKYLGNDTESIGYEKAGIMRRGKNCIFADYVLPKSVAKYAQEIGCKLNYLGQDYTIQSSANSLVINHHGYPTLVVPAPKISHIAAASAVVTTNILQDRLPISYQSLYSGMLNIIIAGRQQVINYNSQKIVLDVSHNPHGVQSLSQCIGNMYVGGKVHAIFSGLADKDLLGMLAPFSNIVDSWYPIVLQSKRAASSELLQEAFTHGLSIKNVKFYQDVESAYEAVTNKYADGDLVIIYGSFLLVGAFMERVLNVPMHKFTRESNYV